MPRPEGLIAARGQIIWITLLAVTSVIVLWLEPPAPTPASAVTAATAD